MGDIEIFSGDVKRYAIQHKISFEEAKKTVEEFGGEGSGNFGHAGREGEVGGSGEGSSGQKTTSGSEEVRGKEKHKSAYKRALIRMGWSKWQDGTVSTEDIKELQTRFGVSEREAKKDILSSSKRIEAEESARESIKDVAAKSNSSVLKNLPGKKVKSSMAIFDLDSRGGDRTKIKSALSAGKEVVFQGLDSDTPEGQIFPKGTSEADMISSLMLDDDFNSSYDIENSDANISSKEQKKLRSAAEKLVLKRKKDASEFRTLPQQPNEADGEEWRS